MIKVVTFDLDDTLWDVRPALLKAEQAQNDWLDRHYPQVLSNLSSEDLRARKRQLITSQPELVHHISRFRQTFLEQLLLEAGVPPAEAGEAAARAFAEFIAHRHKVALFEYAQPVLEEIARHHIIGALTNGNADIRKTPLAHYFNFAFRAEEVGAAKPDPALFRRALDFTGVKAAEVVHVGDSHEHDVIGANGAGLKTVWLSPERENSDIATGVISCLSELPGVLKAL